MSAQIEIKNDSRINLSLTVKYESDNGQHRDVLHAENFNIDRDAESLPQNIKQKLFRQQPGQTEQFHFASGDLCTAFDGARIYSVRNRDFNQQVRQRFSIEPRVGRFYPAAWFAGINEQTVDKMTPVRIIEMDKDRLTVDFNHPLSRYDLDIDITVFDAAKNVNGNNEAGKDSIKNLLTGPGMQLRYEKQLATDFFSDSPFQRKDECDDNVFYSSARMINHLDTTALQQLQSFYASKLPEQGSILDLMASMNSHLPDNINAEHITGLGLNSQELDANSRLGTKVIHDLNDNPVLPFTDASFDTVLCTVSIEYLVQPVKIFDEVARVLKKNGQFFVTFSNRWFPTKSIQLWTNLHEFERMGLVREYFMSNGLYKNINTHSIRGLERPSDDRHNLPLSDPLYAVWGTKI